MPPSPSDAAELSQPTTDPIPSPFLSPDPTPSSPLFTPSRNQDTSMTDPEWSQSPDDSPSPDGSPATSSAPRSTGRGAAARLRELRKTTAAAVATVGGIVHTLLTREGSYERDLQLYLPDDDDVEAISEPLASLASRRLPAGAENPDITDLIRLAFGLLGYGMKQKAKLDELRASVPPEQPQDGLEDLDAHLVPEYATYD